MLREPQSMEELVYYTNRDIGNGSARVWVFRQKCPKCGNALMGKPVGPKGKVKIRAKSYVCPACSYTAEKEEYEETLTASVAYKCPECGSEGELETSFRRKRIHGTETLRFQCQKCSADIDVTRKMKKKEE